MPQPTASGALERTPLTHLLLYCLEHRLHGTLCLSRSSLPMTRDGLGEDQLTVESGIVTAAATREPAIDLRDALVPLCVRAQGQFAFFEGQVLNTEGSSVLRGRLHPHALLVAALRGPYREPVVASVVRDLERELLLVRDDARLESFDFGPEETALVRLLQGRPTTMAELLARGSHRPTAVRRLVYALRVTRALRVVPAGRHQQSGTIAVPAAPTLLAPGTAAAPTRMAAPKRMATPHGKPGMTRPSSAPTVVAQAPATVGQASVRPPLSGGQPRKQGQPATAGAGRGATAENRAVVNRLVVRETSESALSEAASAFRQAKQAMRHQRYADAVPLLKRACRLVPEEAEYLTALAVAKFELSGRRPGAVRKVIRLLELAVTQDPSCEAAHYQLGVVRKHAGDEAAAIQHFQLAHQLNPRNINAAREVRLHSLRRRRADSQGIWTRLVNSVAPPSKTGS